MHAFDAEPTLVDKKPVQYSTQLCRHHEVLTYVEYRAVSDFFQNIDPHPPLRTASVSSPASKAGGTHSPGGEGGGEVNILEDASPRIGLLQ